MYNTTSFFNKFFYLLIENICFTETFVIIVHIIYTVKKKIIQHIVSIIDVKTK